MTDLHGFELVKEQDIPEINSKTKLYRHLKTGAELLSVENEDENKSFAISFTTPPADSTGLPHIMEHSVLCGSRKYAVKEPFIELAKTSQATFLNAMTFSDKTMYPIASQNVQDFYNLIDVYFDAVFYPNITPETLMQEGWHYELEDDKDEMVFKGVVFNEMKGAYSSPEGVLGRFTEQALMPETIYGNDSGGDPEAIPDLTYEQFKRFHETYYHPTNAKIFFYGDDNPEERLRMANDYLKDFEKQDLDTTIETQAAFDEPIRTVVGYDAGDDPDAKSMMTVSWALDDPFDMEKVLSLEILEHILLGTSASPLRKALLESGLGENTTGGGLDTQIRQMAFSTGMKGINLEDAEKVETLILETLAELATTGIDPETVEASLNTVEFQLREANTGRFPRGLVMAINATTTWNFGGNPIDPLAFEAPLTAIKQKIANGDKVFEGLVNRYFVENQHRSTVLLKPDPTVREEKEAREADRLARAREAMSTDEIKQVVEKTRELKIHQETPDSPEALATVPSLHLSDLDREIKKVPQIKETVNGSTVFYHDLFTNGILYVDMGLDLFALPQDLVQYVPLFSTALLEMGTATEDYVKLSQRIGRKTGGIDRTTFNSEHRQDDGAESILFLRGKSTPEQAGELLAILDDILKTTQFDNKDRFKQIVLRRKAQLESGLVPGGHQFVNTRLRSRFNLTGWANEQMGGISQIFFLRELLTHIENDWSSVLGKLVQMRDALLNRDHILFNVTVDQDIWTQFKPTLESFIAGLPATGDQRQAWTPSYDSGNEGLTIPAQVNYVGLGANLYDLGYERTGATQVISNQLGTTWLWDMVRVQGGAYGGFSSFDSGSGVFNFLSYRDPNLLGTLENYHKSVNFLRGLDMSQDELERTIVGAIGEMDGYQLPDAKGYSAMLRDLIGYSDEERQKTRDEVFSTTLADFKKLADALEKLNAQGTVVVVGSREALEDANAKQGENFLKIIKVL